MQRTSIASLAAIAFAPLIAACPRSDNSAEIERIKAKAMAAHPGDPVAATKANNEALESRALAVQSNNPRENAALVFLGYYTKNVFAIPAVCKEQSVDLAAYSSAFVDANKASFAAAASLVDTKGLIERLRPIADKHARSELEGFASMRQTDLKGACSFVRDNAPGMASGTKFSNVMPKIHEILVSR